MNMRKNKLLKKLIFPVSVSLFSVILSCQKTEEPAKADVIIEGLDQKIRQSFILKPNEETMSAIYKSAGKNLPGAPTTRADIIKSLLSISGASRNQALHSTLQTILENLKPGINEFRSAESMKWSSPERNTGIGLVLHKDGTAVKSLYTIEGSPAHQANLPSGASLEAVDGFPVSGLTLDEIVGRIRGTADSAITLKLNGKEYTLKRKPFSFDSISHTTWKGKNGDIEYFVIRAALPGTAANLKQILLKMGKRDTVILDLRMLQPGDYQECFKIADIFIAKGKMGSIKMRSTEEIFEADSEILFSEDVYVVMGAKASPYAATLASAMKIVPHIIYAGVDIAAPAFVTKPETIEGYQFHITQGAVYDAHDRPLYETGLKTDIKVLDDTLPGKLLDKPDLTDPVQKRFAEMFGI